MIGAGNRAPEMAPSVFDAVGVNRLVFLIAHVLPGSMFDDFMLIDLAQVPIADPLIRMHRTAGLDVGQDLRFQRLSFGVFDNPEPRLAVPFDHPENGCLGFRAATPAVGHFLVFVLPPIFPADERFIRLNVTL